MEQDDNPHDKIFKQLIGRPELAADLIKGLCQHPSISRLDLTSLAKENATYIDKTLQECYSDLVFTASCKGEEQRKIKIALLLEHKSYKPQNEFLQLLRYMLNIWDTQTSNKEALQLVIPIIVYHGRDKWQARPFKALFDNTDEELLEFLPDFHYILGNISTKSEKTLREELFDSRVNQLLTLLYKHCRNDRYLAANVKQLFSLVLKGMDAIDREIIVSLYIYFAAISRLPPEDIMSSISEISPEGGDIVMTTYQQLINQGIEQGINLGKQEGKQEGMQQGKRETRLENAVALLKNHVPLEAIAKSLKLSNEEIQQVLAESSKNSRKKKNDA